MTDSNKIEQDVKDQVLEAADKCVACGMCLPHCPTYTLFRQESESPRGRISLIAASFNDELDMDEVLQKHLDHCLLCRACERVCPAQVPFAHLMDTVRANSPERVRSGAWLKKRLLGITAQRRQARRLLSLFKRFNLGAILRRILKADSAAARYLEFAEKMAQAPDWQSCYRAEGKERFRVGLLLGCVQEFFDQRSLDMTIKVLNRLGVTVLIPDSQTCCGAMHLHAGAGQQAEQLYRQNRDSFAQAAVDTVISLSSACTATLQECHDTRGGSSDTAAAHTDQVFNVIGLCTFLENINWSNGLTLHSLNANVLVHTPCTQANVLKDPHVVHTVLSRIPGLTVSDMPVTQCCGAAGTYTLEYPQISAQLQQAIARHVVGSEGYLVSNNIGCILQLRDICNKNTHIEVLDPVNLVARALGIE